MNQISKSFGDFFFNNVFLSPAVINAGVVTPSDTFEFELWHSFTTDKLLAGINESGADGIVLDGVASGLLPGFVSSDYLVFLSQSGGGIISYEAGFDFGSSGVFPFRLSATMAAILADGIDWSTQPEMNVQYLTEVIESFDGTEQRIALRDQPRVSLTYQYLLHDSVLTEFDVKYGNFGGQLLVPMWPQACELTHDVDPGDRTINVELNRYVECSNTLMLTDGVNSEFVDVAGVGAGQVVLSFLAQKNFKMGSRVVPVRIGYSSDESGAEIKTDSIASHNITFELAETAFAKPVPVDSFERYKGKYLIPFRPDRSTDITVQYQRLREHFDPTIGARSIYERTPGAVRIFSHSFRFFSEKERQNFEDFAELQNGAQGEFWMQSASVAMEIAEDIYDETYKLKIKPVGYGRLDKSKSFPPAIVVHMYNGTAIKRSLVSAKAANGFEELILDEPLSDIKIDDVESIKPLYLCRFESDDFRYIFDTTQDSTITKTIRQLLHADTTEN
ncbi:hypothetical protein NOV18_08770 [Pseudomonas asiatica]|uniref:Uncharacterized protein n=1 Tax=Pseudomonas asiatica TaxID=2219225 RepID=A0AAJ5HZT1_9PSED|nr:hypothetical protein [Pseudomonas asiatica]UUC20557.1 hypothetical protein NOV18_08770 [Pseudomonas asiatica]